MSWFPFPIGLTIPRPSGHAVHDGNFGWSGSQVLAGWWSPRFRMSTSERLGVETSNIGIYFLPYRKQRWSNWTTLFFSIRCLKPSRFQPHLFIGKNHKVCLKTVQKNNSDLAYIWSPNRVEKMVVRWALFARQLKRIRPGNSGSCLKGLSAVVLRRP